METKIVVRLARRSDLGRLAELLAVFDGTPLSPKEMQDRFNIISQDPDQSLAVAIVNRSVVGVVGFRIRYNLESVTHYGEVSVIVVDEAWRNRGVGAALLQYAEKLARRRQCIGLWLVSGYGREEDAHKFYVAKGFTPTGVRFVKPLP